MLAGATLLLSKGTHPKVVQEMLEHSTKTQTMDVAGLMRKAGLFGCGGRRRKARTIVRSQYELTLLPQTW